MSKSYISISVSINKNEKKDKEKQLEDVKKQKQELIKRFQKKNKELVKKQNNLNNATNEVVAEKVHIKRTNEQKLNKKIQELEKKLKAIQEENLKFRIRENDLKKEGYIIKKANNELKDEIHQIKKSIDEKNLKIKELLAEIDYLTSPNEIVIHQSKKIMKLNKRIENYKNKEAHLTKLVNKMNLEINNAESLGKFSYKEKYEESIRRYNNMVSKHNNLKELYTNVLEKYNNIQDRQTYNMKIYSLKETINTLKQVNENIIQKYELNRTLLLLELWMKFTYRNKLQSKNGIENNVQNQQISSYSTKNIAEVQEIKKINRTVQKTKKYLNIQYGYLFIENGLFYVKTLEDNIYLIINEEKCIDTLPCKIRIIKEKALLLKVYKDTKNVIKTIKEKTTNKDKIDKTKELKELFAYYETQFEGITVLIVGSNYKNIYVSSLTQCGINVIWHDSFEESEVVLSNKIKGSDIVIVCADHVFHRVLDFIEDNDKFQIVYNDTVKTILARIKFALIAMGKL